MNQMRNVSGIALLGFIFMIAALSPAASGKVYHPEMNNCAGFTAADAAGLLKSAAGAVKSGKKKLGDSLWTCWFSAGAKTIAFSVQIAKTAENAAADMSRYRENLELTAETAPFRDRLPKGAWSEILELGDESTWTDVNGTLTVRLGNITYQVQKPEDKLGQIAVVQVLLNKL